MTKGVCVCVTQRELSTRKDRHLVTKSDTVVLYIIYILSFIEQLYFTYISRVHSELIFKVLTVVHVVLALLGLNG